jgi:2-methylisocitrate lyase-like PEP mutase family enzyme
MSQKERALRFASLHVKGEPVILYNAWDAGSARAIAAAGSPAIATSSWAVAAAQSYEDGESIPLPFVEQILARVIAAVDVPVTVDAEGGYGDDPDVAAQNIARLVDLGAVGVNFEDRIVTGKGLHEARAQSRRIAAIRRAADAHGIPLFINARTDIWFGTGIAAADALRETQERAAAYADAGASGLFVPGLVDLRAIETLSRSIELPVNVMMMEGLPDARALANAGVARISYGPASYRAAMETVRTAARAALRVA